MPFKVRTVKDLIEQLSKFSPYTQVVICDISGENQFVQRLHVDIVATTKNTSPDVVCIMGIK